jgi:hypothetical protein
VIGWKGRVVRERGKVCWLDVPLHSLAHPASAVRWSNAKKEGERKEGRKNGRKQTSIHA